MGAWFGTPVQRLKQRTGAWFLPHIFVALLLDFPAIATITRDSSIIYSSNFLAHASMEVTKNNTHNWTSNYAALLAADRAESTVRVYEMMKFGAWRCNYAAEGGERWRVGIWWWWWRRQKNIGPWTASAAPLPDIEQWWKDSDEYNFGDALLLWFLRRGCC
ncbi:hypothetical protein L1987_77884 [Smallanthus sonchifolius]|uniref:Uncharacterized protein n=2 Tax=Smallanthus sonchifolius TaxID=185202 RepID=A0ACB8ZC65_9ASTR|nr:hypothetical protein L1987_77882 [Smallanthus sonchifolius]KAI3694901.1 hypothetical protein L1987_77884 [Smallanthus sonchifolius]